MLLPEVKDPRYRDIRELKVRVVVYVKVVYPTDGAACGVEDLLLAEFVVRGRGCWWCASRVRFMGLSSLPSAVRRVPHHATTASSWLGAIGA